MSAETNVSLAGGGGGWHEAKVLVCLPLAAPIKVGRVVQSAIGAAFGFTTGTQALMQRSRTAVLMGTMDDSPF